MTLREVSLLLALFVACYGWWQEERRRKALEKMHAELWDHVHRSRCALNKEGRRKHGEQKDNDSAHDTPDTA